VERAADGADAEDKRLICSGSVACDRARAHAEIAELQPDTVLIEEPEGDVPSEAIGILEAGSRDLRVIRLSLANNELTVYDRKQRKMVAPEDLLNMIERG